MRQPVHDPEAPRPKRTPIYADTPVNGNGNRPHLDPSINPTINPDGVPAALRSQPRWILWRWVKRRQGDGTTKMTKVPMSAITGQIGVDAHDPANWTTFDVAVAAAWTPGTLADGLGFDLIKDDPIVGVDLDHCIEKGKIADWAQMILTQLKTYAEQTPSGKGLRLFCFGALPPHGRKKDNVELYTDRRFLTVTGHRIPECPPTVEARAAELAALHLATFGPPPAERPLSDGPTTHSDLADDDLLARARAARNGKKFIELWEGRGPSDRSAGDLALCNLLAFWTGKNREQMDQLFRASARMRAKWDERHFSDGTTHGEATVAKALDSCRNVYGPPPQDERTQIEADIGDLKVASDAAWDVLVRANEPPVLFTLGSELMELEPGDEDRPVLHRMTKERLRHRMAEVARYVVLNDVTNPKTGETETTTTHARPPMDVMVNMLSGARGPVPTLSRIVYTPVFTAEGTLLQESGYHPESGVYCALPPGFRLPPIAEHPTADEIAQARQRVVELVETFPFVGAADLAGAFTLPLGPLVRDLIPGQMPALIVDKPLERTGASLMVSGLLRLALGQMPQAWTLPTSEEEMEKRLTTILRQAPSMVFFDNVNVLDSAALSMAITAERPSFRLLGGNESLDPLVRCGWVFTANNLRASGELIGRSTHCRLDAKTDHPERRTFARPDTQWLAWIDHERPALLAALATLVRGWLARGRPSGTATGPAGFSGWTTVMGGILHVAGVPDFLGNQAQFRERVDDTLAAFRVFVRKWETLHRDQAVTTHRLYASIMVQLDAPLLDLNAKTDERGQKIQLGRLIARHVDQVFTFGGGGRVVVRRAGETRDSVVQWRLEYLGAGDTRGMSGGSA